MKNGEVIYVLLNMNIRLLENNVDPDQLAY